MEVSAEFKPLRVGWCCEHSSVKCSRFTSLASSAKVCNHMHYHKPTGTTPNELTSTLIYMLNEKSGYAQVAHVNNNRTEVHYNLSGRW